MTRRRVTRGSPLFIGAARLESYQESGIGLSYRCVAKGSVRPPPTADRFLHRGLARQVLVSIRTTLDSKTVSPFGSKKLSKRPPPAPFSVSVNVKK